jgi:DNA helicase-2/ATP-dependent DNA helicase PcrA
LSISPEEWRKEQARVDEVVGEVEKKAKSMQQHLTSLKSEVVAIRKDFWEDVRVNVDEPHELIETFTTIKQQAEFLSERERSHGHSAYLQSKLERLRQSPYFGRIDFCFEGEEVPEPIYLGIASFLNEDDEFLVYDWRAPISSLYYDSLPGPAQYKTHVDVVRGDITLKRQYIIKNSEIHGMFDTGLAIGDELLQEVLGQHSDTQMKTIVATIQKEQNQIIRNEKSKFLIVQGAAGSGKTSAALQRVAYLLYRYRETLEAEHIVLFSPNSLFNDYVSTVLPELGERNMQQTTFQDFLYNKLGNQFEVENPFTQMEYTLTAYDTEGYNERISGIKYKSSKSFLFLLNQYLTYLANEGLSFYDITFREKTIFSSQQLKEMFLELDKVISIPNRLQLLTEEILTRLKKIARKELREKWVEEELQYLDKETYLKAYQKLQRNNKKQFSEEAFNDLALEQEFLSKLVVKNYFKPIRRFIKEMSYINFEDMYESIFTDQSMVEQLIDKNGIPNNWDIICQQTIHSLDQGKIYYEDEAPYVYLKEQILGRNKNTSVRHLFIDEAQDYSEVQLAVLKMLFPNSNMTLLGDLNQAIFIHSSNGYTAFDPYSPLKDDSRETIKLTRSYRSTKEIVEFTRELVIDGDQIQPFNRSGTKPILTSVTQEKQLVQLVYNQVSSLQERGTTHIAVICKTAKESEQVFNQLNGKLELKLIKKETSSYEPGVVVIPAYLAKGIEFDAVIIYNASKEVYGRDTERKLFYTASTRAMHELFINSDGEVNEFMKNIDPNLYEFQQDLLN